MLDATRAPRRVSRGGRAQIVGEVLVADELLTYQFLQEGCRLPDNDGRDMGSWVSASPAVRRYRTSHEAVRSPRRLGKPAKNGSSVSGRVASLRSNERPGRTVAGRTRNVDLAHSDAGKAADGRLNVKPRAPRRTAFLCSRYAPVQTCTPLLRAHGLAGCAVVIPPFRLMSLR
jgi:hypothetical protein